MNILYRRVSYTPLPSPFDLHLFSSGYLHLPLPHFMTYTLSPRVFISPSPSQFDVHPLPSCQLHLPLPHHLTYILSSRVNYIFLSLTIWRTPSPFVLVTYPSPSPFDVHPLPSCLLHLPLPHHLTYILSPRVSCIYLSLTIWRTSSPLVLFASPSASLFDVQPLPTC